MTRERKARERGAASIVMVGVLVAALGLCVGAARLGSALVARAEADTAADAAALAAADALALGQGSDVARVAAEETAARNGARLVRCVCAGDAAEVEVVVPVRGLAGWVGPATGRARAEVDLACAVTPGEC